jgi:4-aminobutyrate aminotransferase
MVTSSEYIKPQISTTVPGRKARQIMEADERVTSTSYTRPYPLVVESARGVWVRDVDGNVFLDCNAGVAVCATGHCHPEVVRAIQEQSEQLIHMCGADYFYPSLASLATKLTEISPVPSPARVLFTNSGTESMEAALKLAMYYTGRTKFIAFFDSFHGRTLGSLSLTSSKPVQRNGFGRQALDVTHVPYAFCNQCPFGASRKASKGCCLGSLEWIEERLFKSTVPPEECAAIVVECVQGEGGYVPAPREFLLGLRRICDRHGILLIVDEVQSGMGRTGKMFACDHYGLEPDILCLAKGIASGLPLGVCIARADVMNWPPGAHASTFGGNPVAIAAALKTIELLEKELIANSREVGKYLENGLRQLMSKHRLIRDVRGLGMMLGVEFGADSNSHMSPGQLAERVASEAFHRGLILLTAGKSTIRWSPPLILTREQAAVALEIFDEAITAAAVDGESGKNHSALEPWVSSGAGCKAYFSPHRHCIVPMAEEWVNG